MMKQKLIYGTGTFRDYKVFDTRLARAVSYPSTPLGTVSLAYPFNNQLVYYNNGEFVHGENYSVSSFFMDFSSAYNNGFRITNGLGLLGVGFSPIKNIVIP